MAAMMLMLKKFNNAFSINIIAAISWPPPLILQPHPVMFYLSICDF